MKKKIEEILKKIIIHKKNIIEFVENIEISNEKIIIFLILPNPSMHLKMKIINSIMNSIKHRIKTEKKVYIKTKINLKLKNYKKNISINNIIAVASGKGGVGKSTIVSNISVSLKSRGFSVGILDADIYGPSIPLMFNIKIDDASFLYKNGLINPILTNGIKILSIGFFLKNDKAIVWRGPMVTKALMQLIYEVNWGSLDFLIIDLPPGTGDIHLSLLQEKIMKGVLLVSTSQKIALSDVLRTVKMFQTKPINVPLLGIIENMSFFHIKEKKYFLFGKDMVKKFSYKINIPFLGKIPIIQDIQIYSDEGIPPVLKNIEVKEIFDNITKKFLKKLF